MTMKLKFNDEIISCPNCGKKQSKIQYIEECCWECGSITPIQPYTWPISASTEPEALPDQEDWQNDIEAKIKKMSDY